MYICLEQMKNVMEENAYYYALNAKKKKKKRQKCHQVDLVKDTPTVHFLSG